MVFGEKLLRGKKDIPDVYCAICQKNAGPSGYAAKKEWDIEGKLCSTCFGNLLGAYGKDSTETSESSQKESNQQNKKLKENCPKCNSVNLDGAKFCSSCGTNLQIKCLECGNFPPEGSKFCNQCGNPV